MSIGRVDRNGPGAAILARRGQWRWRGGTRPSFATPPGIGQESVWDYPRPPRVEVDTRAVSVGLGDLVIAESARALRVLETASPPTFYLPAEDVDRSLLRADSKSSVCEWKGQAAYWSVQAGSQLIEAVAWTYANPFPEFEVLTGRFAFHPDRLQCTLDGAAVAPQPGGFYGGWVTSELVGPFKGEPGSGDW